MDRTDRLLLEHQINDLDGMIRQMTNMRSVLVRRTNRMLASAPPRLPGRAASVPSSATRQAHIIEQIDPDLMDHWQNNANEDNVNQDVARALIRLFDDEADDEIRRVQQYVPPSVPYSRAHVNHDPLPVLYPFVRIVSKPKQKISVIKKADLVRTMPEPCSICQESYTKLMSVTANCGHGCCKGCMTQWLDTKYAAGQNATCPMCRVKVTMVTGYRERAKPHRKVAVASSSNSSVEDEDDVNSMDVVV